MTQRWIAEENNYRALAKEPPSREVDIAVIIPAFNHPDVLDRTLAGFTNQTKAPVQIIVVDDSSTDDLTAVVDHYVSRLPISLLRQEFEGNGAGPARNLGYTHATADVYLFVDSDCIPHTNLVERHAFWHNRATNVTVAGARFHIDASQVTPADIAGGQSLDELVLTKGVGTAPTEDWRRHVGRRHKAFTIGGDGYRAALSSNLSVTADAITEVGGFSDAYITWGGEDTELGWRLWNSGTFLVPENKAVVYHQTQHDPPYDENRQAARTTNRALMTDRIPQQFYRKRPSAAYSTPKLTWIVAVQSEEDVQTVQQRLSDDQFGDVELILVGPDVVLGPIELLNRSAQRTRIVIDEDGGGFERAALIARGEYLLLVDGRIRFDGKIVTKAIAALDSDTQTSVVRCPYRVAGKDTYRRLDELASLDQTFASHVGTLFAVIRRRDLMKDRVSLKTPITAVAKLSLDGDPKLFINDHAELPASLNPGQDARFLGPAELTATTPTDLARAAVRAVRKLQRGSTVPQDTLVETPPSGAIGIDYIGYAGAGNFGDEAMLLAVRQLMPWADIRRDHPDPTALMVGGGTLINVRNYYLNRIRRNDSPQLERVLFGTGVRNPGFWGITENISEWSSFIEASLYAGVRGPYSVENLRALGHEQDIEILGDPALSLRRPDVDHVPGRVVVCPVWTSGELHGGSDASVFATLATTIRRLRANGHEVVMLSAYQKDDRWLIQLMREAGAPDMPYVPAHFEVDDALELIASADLVIAERLHAGVVAAAVGTPFVPIEYRPKTLDFAASINSEQFVVRTDQMNRLDEVVDTLLANPKQQLADTAIAVERFRQRQGFVADQLHHSLTNPDPQPWIQR